MKALSVRQPYAFLIVAGFKDIENRTWQTRYRGPLLIHAAKKEDWLEIAAGLARVTTDEFPFKTLARRIVFGAVVGRVMLVDVVRDHPSSWAVPGRHHWVLAHPELIEPPIPCRGHQYLFTPDC